MVSSDLLDVVLGVVFAWFILSLVCSALGESFNWLTRVRSKLLWRSLSQLFDSGVKAADARLRTLVLELPKGGDDRRPTATTEDSAFSGRRKKKNRPGAATAPEATEQLYDIVRRRVADPAPGGWRTRISSIPTEVIGDAFESLAAQTVTKASLLEQVDDDQLRSAISGLEHSVLDDEHDRPLIPEALRAKFDSAWIAAKRTVTIEDLEALLGGNQTLLERVRLAVGNVTGSAVALNARAEVERWFDGAMDGLTTFFRRQNRKLLAIIAAPSCCSRILVCSGWSTASATTRTCAPLSLLRRRTGQPQS